MTYATSTANATRCRSNCPISLADRTAEIIYLVCGVIEVFIALRVIFKVPAANPYTGFTSLMYTITQPLVALFQGAFPYAESQGSVLEVILLLARLVYALLAFGIMPMVCIMGNWQTPGTPAPMSS